MRQTPITEITIPTPEESSDDTRAYISKLLQEKGIDMVTKYDTCSEDVTVTKSDIENEERLFHVPAGLEKLNETAYKPQIISIGPRYNDPNNENLDHMEWKKDCHFEEYIDDKKKEKCAEVVVDMKKRIHKWYKVSNKEISEEKLNIMMLLDGCFVILLLLGKVEKMPWINQTTLLGDLLLFENQLPFFLLEKLYSIIKDPKDEPNFAELAWTRLRELLPDSRTNIPFNIQNTSKIDTLLGLVHNNWVGSRQGTDSESQQGKSVGGLKLIRCAAELEEAGIVFKPYNSVEISLFDVEIEDRNKMKIPTLKIDSLTERVLLNLIAYEVRVQHSRSYVIDYARLMFNLVKTDKDVQALRLSEVIQNNMLADDAAVAKMFKNLLREVEISDESFVYYKLFEEVKKHCDGRWSQSIASLRHNYLNTPWKRISLAAAIVVFLITVTQLITTFVKKS